jgi:hypothetical protein
MSFWTADEKIPVQQTKVNIPAEHGLDYNAGQKIEIIVPPTIKYFQPRESYLRFDVQLKVDSTNPVKLSLDGETGAQCLIRDIRIHSGGSGAVLLEELQNYNTLVALMYDYETNDAIKNKRAMTEGSLCWSQENRSTLGNTKTIMNQTRHSPYTTPYIDQTSANPERTKAGDGALNWGETGNTSQGSQYNLAKVLIPLHTGIFQSPKVYPSLLTEGLRIEIILEDAARCVRLADTMHPNRRRTLGLQFHSISGIDNNIDTGGAGPWIDTQANTEFYVQRTNNITSLENCPFVIGQKICLYKSNAWAGANGWSGATKRAKFSVDLIITGLKFHAATGNTTGAGGKYGLLQISFASTINQTGENIDSTWFVKDDSILECVCTTGVPSNATLIPTYQVKNVELILQTLTMPPGYTNKLMSMMSAGGAMNYDFLSFTNYKYSQLKGDRVMNMRLPLNQTKAKSILCVPTDSSVYSARQQIAGEDDDAAGYQNPGAAGVNNQYPAVAMPTNLNYVEDLDLQDEYNVSCRSGLVGICDEVTDYQFFYNGQLNPSRKVECEKISRRVGVQQQQLIELEKALAMAGINPLSFMKYKENFCIGRALALQQGVYNTAGRDFNLQVNYQSTTAPVKDKLWCNYVAHIRRLMVQGDSVVIQI